MLMEQIIEFELRVPKPLVVHVLLKGRGLANGTFAVLFFPRKWSRRYE